MVPQSLDVGVPRVPLATPTGVAGLVGVRFVTADNCGLFVPGLLRCLATTCSFWQGLSCERPLDAPHEAPPPTLPGLVWVPLPVTPTRDIRQERLALPSGGSMAAALPR